MGLLMQREVAERLTAHPGTRDYGYLTVATQLFTKPEIALEVPPGAFAPPPKVQSSFVTFQMQEKFERWSPQRYDRFLEFVKACFAKKRKNLLNNLTYPRKRVQEALEAMGKGVTARAEEFSVDELATLYEGLQAAGSSTSKPK
jgi:16S rRNA (adenine1518-N6/adenine1519-N6)-dimethyltransferase